IELAETRDMVQLLRHRYDVEHIAIAGFLYHVGQSHITAAAGFILDVTRYVEELAARQYALHQARYFVVAATGAVRDDDLYGGLRFPLWPRKAREGAKRDGQNNCGCLLEAFSLRDDACAYVREHGVFKHCGSPRKEIAEKLIDVHFSPSITYAVLTKFPMTL